MPTLEECNALSKRRRHGEYCTSEHDRGCHYLCIRRNFSPQSAAISESVAASLNRRLAASGERPALDDLVLRPGATGARLDEHKVIHVPGDRTDRLSHVAPSHVTRERHVRPIFLLSNLELFAQESESQLLRDVRQLWRRTPRREAKHVRTRPNLDLIELEVKPCATHLGGAAHHSFESTFEHAADKCERDVEILGGNRAAAARLDTAAHRTC